MMTMVEQQGYTLVGRPVTHRVEADVTRTLARVHAHIVNAWQRLGPEARFILTVETLVPTRNLLGSNDGEAG
jgi:hypothetical protein